MTTRENERTKCKNCEKSHGRSFRGCGKGEAGDDNTGETGPDHGDHGNGNDHGNGGEHGNRNHHGR